MRSPVVTSRSFDRRLLQVVCFAGSPVVMACSTLLLRRVAADAGQTVAGILLAGTLSVALVALGIVGSRRTPAR
jgi:hypothetical protein